MCGYVHECAWCLRRLELSDVLELKLQMVMSCRVGTGNRTLTAANALTAVTSLQPEAGFKLQGYAFSTYPHNLPAFRV